MKQVVALLAVSLTVAACDPCAGVVGCVTSSHVAIQGRLVDVDFGRSVSGARISLVRADVATRDSSATTTDDGGNFQVDLASKSGTFDVLVEPSALPPYRVRGLELRSSTRNGDGNVLGVWVNRPAFGTALELIHRNGTPVVGGSVAFRRTGGVLVSGDGSFSGSIDAGGRVAFLPGTYAAGTDDVIGVLTVDAGDSLGPSVIPDFRFSPSHEFRPRDVRRLAVGPRLDWHIRVYDRATIATVPGTVVTFRRTGGIPTSPTTFTATSDANGIAVLPVTALKTGVVTGDLTVTPPAPYRAYVTTGFQLQSFEDDVAKSLALGVGPHLPWLGVVQCNGRALAGVSVVVVRVGGIDATPTRSVVTSDANGYFSLVFKPATYGDLIVDLEFTPPTSSGCIGYVQHGLHLPTLDIDSDARFIAAWDLPKR